MRGWRIDAVGLDANRYLAFETFAPLRDPCVFAKVMNGGYYVEWDCGADLSADSIEARWRVLEQMAPKAPA